MPQCLHMLQEQAGEVCGRKIYQVPLSATVQPLVQEFVQQQIYKKSKYLLLFIALLGAYLCCCHHWSRGQDGEAYSLNDRKALKS